jgi:hypothetical protein
MRTVTVTCLPEYCKNFSEEKKIKSVVPRRSKTEALIKVGQARPADAADGTLFSEFSNADKKLTATKQSHPIVPLD